MPKAFEGFKNSALTIMKIGTIPFTQFLRPNGRKEQVAFECDDAEVLVKAQRIIASGLRFECEVLMTGECSFTISNDEEDLAHEIVFNGNGPGVPEAIRCLVMEFNLGEKEV